MSGNNYKLAVSTIEELSIFMLELGMMIASSQDNKKMIHDIGIFGKKCKKICNA